MVRARRLNHAVLYVRDVARSVAFYERVLGFEVISSIPNGMAAFLRSGFDENHHDLALFQVEMPGMYGTPAADAPPVPIREASAPDHGRVGLFHLAWEVDSITDLAAVHDLLVEMGALVGSTDHSVTKSLYGVDPDGIEFEVMWAVPEEVWRANPDATLDPLDLAAEVARWGPSA
jgi:catechol-2,3-dioxygenase